MGRRRFKKRRATVKKVNRKVNKLYKMVETKSKFSNHLFNMSAGATSLAEVEPGNLGDSRNTVAGKSYYCSGIKGVYTFHRTDSSSTPVCHCRLVGIWITGRYETTLPFSNYFQFSDDRSTPTTTPAFYSSLQPERKGQAKVIFDHRYQIPRNSGPNSVVKKFYVPMNKRVDFLTTAGTGVLGDIASGKLYIFAITNVSSVATFTGTFTYYYKDA